MEITAAGTVQDLHLIPFWLVPERDLLTIANANIGKNEFEVQGVGKKFIKVKKTIAIVDSNLFFASEL